MALKVIRNKKRFHKQAMTEIKLLSVIKELDAGDNSNVIRIIESFPFRSHLCITFPLMSMNLYEFIKQNNFQGVRYVYMLCMLLLYISILYCNYIYIYI